MGQPELRNFSASHVRSASGATEPNPGGGTVSTNYAYTALNQLSGVSMTRGEHTQTRTFAWTGLDMTGATNPENGTVAYAYFHHQLQTRIDAKGQKTAYFYDQYGRLTDRRYYLPIQGGGWQEQTKQWVHFYYDYKPSNPSSYQWGRMTGADFGGGAVACATSTATLRADG